MKRRYAVPKFVNIGVEPKVRQRLRELAMRDGRTVYGIVRVSLDLYEEWHKQAEQVVELQTKLH